MTQFGPILPVAIQVIEASQDPLVLTLAVPGLPGEKGDQGDQGNPAPGSPTFIQPGQPTTAQLDGNAAYVWWDTSGGALTLWIEDGEN